VLPDERLRIAQKKSPALDGAEEPIFKASSLCIVGRPCPTLGDYPSRQGGRQTAVNFAQLPHAAAAATGCACAPGTRPVLIHIDFCNFVV
jgi:hypothetical protein